MSWGRGTSYVVHCAQCHRLVKKTERDGMAACPPERENTILEGFPMVSFGDHKQDRNYPQWAPNLPKKDALITSWNDYERKLEKHGKVIVEASSNDRDRAKFYKRKTKDFTRDPTFRR